jgi:hypothetical protein
MAENIDNVQQQLAEAMRQAADDYARYGQLQTTTSQQLFDAQMKQKLGSESATKGLNTMGQALGAVAGAGIESAKAMYQGKKDATAFNASLGELAKAATLAGTALTLLMPGGIIMKGIVAAVTMLTGAVIATVQAANEMNAKLYKGYEGLAKSGAAASDGMTGVFKDAKKLGLSMDQLDSYVGLVTENSQELALFAGSVAGGRKKFADMGEALESSRVGFFAMGISQQEQNEGMMRFTKTMTQAGRAQTMTSKELADGARSYIMEQDKLAKLTGISAQKQQALLDRARENEQFNAKIRALELEGTAESKAAADGLRKGLIIAAAAGDDAAEGFMASVNGNLRNEKARELNMTAQGEQMRSIQNILNGMDPAQAMQPMFKSMANFEKTVGIPLNQLGAGAGVFLKTSTMANAANLATMDVAEMSAKIDKDTALQRKGAGDAMTGEEARQIKERQDQNKKAEEAVFKTIENAQAVNAKLLGTTNKLIDAFDKLTTVVTKVLDFFGFGPDISKSEKKQTEITSVEQSLKQAIAAASTAKTPEEKALIDGEIKFLNEKIQLLSEEKAALKVKEKNAAFEEEVLKRAEHDVAMKQKEYDRVTKDATAGDIIKAKMGLGPDHLVKADKDLQASLVKKANLSTRGHKDSMANQVEALKATGYEPPTKGKGGTGANAKPEDVLEFSGASGGRENFDGLGADMKGALLSAGQQYFEQTGQKLKMNSGFRSPEDQLRLYNETKNANRPGVGPTGMPVAQPGSSPHETGQAVDIQNFTDPKALNALNSAGLRQTVPKDPVHFQLQAADGGVFSGPDSGYPAALHGEEAVIPLNNGGGNFVKVFEDMAMMIGQQVGAMDELIRIAKNGNDIQTKILRVQQ